MPNTDALAQSAITTLPGGYKVFVGPRDDPFFVDLAAVFDLLSIRRLPGNAGKGVDGVGGFNVSERRPSDAERANHQGRDGAGSRPEQSRHRTLGRPSAADRTLQGDGTVALRARGPGLAARHAARERDRDPGREEGSLQRERARPGRGELRAYVVDPEPARPSTPL
jgi:hypothetical protein